MLLLLIELLKKYVLHMQCVEKIKCTFFDIFATFTEDRKKKKKKHRSQHPSLLPSRLSDAGGS